MPLYLYVFGFESPWQLRNNDAQGWDHEDSQGVLIDAADEAAALAWGQEISERFIKLLFRNQEISWRDRGYANWIETPAGTWPDQQRVTVGEFPDFTSWLPPDDGEA
jgi:hypothetical protein